MAVERELMTNAEIKKINEILATCHRVKESVDTKGWQEIIEPMIDKSIQDILGGKVGGKWHGGLLDKARKDERREYYIGYKQALIDLHTRVYAYVNSIKMYDDKKAALVKETESPRYVAPMENTRYGE